MAEGGRGSRAGGLTRAPSHPSSQEARKAQLENHEPEEEEEEEMDLGKEAQGSGKGSFSQSPACPIEQAWAPFGWRQLSRKLEIRCK